MKTFIAIAVLGATLATTGGAVANSGKFDAPLSPVASSQAIPGIVANPRRCLWPRTSAHNEKVKLGQAGYRKFKYLGTKTFMPRCAKFFYFSACKYAQKYRVIVRYIGIQRYVIAQHLGNCVSS